MKTSIELERLIRDSSNLEKYAIAQTISLLELEDSREIRGQIFPLLHSLGLKENGISIGITGTPGSGKSSLIGEIAKIFLDKEMNRSLAIVAIDPSSNNSGGSILGDRTRVVLPKRDKRIYFRSQASKLELGGVNPHTYHVIRLLRHFFDYVIIETVGIGQNEIEISHLSDCVFLVMQPLGGDQVQFMKSGIMEIPNAFIINKMDEESLGLSSYHLLQNTLEFLRNIFPGKNIPPVFKTSATKKLGVLELWEYIKTLKHRNDKVNEVTLQLEKWVRNEYGRFGIRIFEDWRSSQLNLHSKLNGNISLNSNNFENMENGFLCYFKKAIARE